MWIRIYHIPKLTGLYLKLFQSQYSQHKKYIKVKKKISNLKLILFLCIITSCSSEDDLYSYTFDNDSYNCSYEKYMSLQPPGNHYVQGSACYEDYFIQGYHSNDCITIYNIKEKKCLSTIKITDPTPSKYTHANTINFGNQRYDSNDYFPLLYISSGYKTDGASHIYVYRLQKEEKGKTETFTISLVQTISLHFENWTEGIIDSDSEYMWIKYSQANQNGFAKFIVPSVNEGDVDIYYEDNLDYFKVDRIPSGSRDQGYLYKDGKIIFVAGVPSSGEVTAIVSIDVVNKQQEFVIGLAEVGLVNPQNSRDNAFEPEGVIIYKGQLMICYKEAIYSFDYKKK